MIWVKKTEELFTKACGASGPQQPSLPSSPSAEDNPNEEQPPPLPPHQSPLPRGILLLQSCLFQVPLRNPLNGHEEPLTKFSDWSNSVKSHLPLPDGYYFCPSPLTNSERTSGSGGLRGWPSSGGKKVEKKEKLKEKRRQSPQGSHGGIKGGTGSPTRPERWAEQSYRTRKGLSEDLSSWTPIKPVSGMALMSLSVLGKSWHLL